MPGFARSIRAEPPPPGTVRPVPHGHFTFLPANSSFRLWDFPQPWHCKTIIAYSKKMCRPDPLFIGDCHRPGMLSSGAEPHSGNPDIFLGRYFVSSRKRDTLSSQFAAGNHNPGKLILAAVMEFHRGDTLSSPPEPPNHIVGRCCRYPLPAPARMHDRPENAREVLGAARHGFGLKGQVEATGLAGTTARRYHPSKQWVRALV